MTLQLDEDISASSTPAVQRTVQCNNTQPLTAVRPAPACQQYYYCAALQVASKASALPELTRLTLAPATWLPLWSPQALGQRGSTATILRAGTAQ